MKLVEDAYQLQVVRGHFRGDAWWFPCMTALDAFISNLRRSGTGGLVKPFSMVVKRRTRSGRYVIVGRR